MPYDWIFEVETILIRLIPAYTLEALDNCDIERILPYYFFDYRKALKANNSVKTDDENTVIRNGKKYRKVKAGQVAWADKIF